MKKVVMIISLMMAFSMMVAPAVMADTLYLNGVNGQIDLTGQVYIDPYQGGNSSTAMNNIFCIDPMHESYVNTHWTVNVTVLDTNTSLSNTYLKDAGRVQYEKMAYLIIYNMGNWGKSGALSQNQAIQAAIWYIANPGTNGNGYGQNNSWVTFAAANYTKDDYSNVEILSSTNFLTGGYINQEFIEIVPEPTTILLLGFGLVGLAAFRRKFKK